MTTDNKRVFRNPFNDQWYFWDDAWACTHGPYDEYVDAHAALTAMMEANGKENQASSPPNCS